MILNVASLPEDYDVKKALDVMKHMACIPINTSIQNNEFSDLVSSSNEFEERLDRMGSTIDKLLLRIFVLENRLSHTEADNIFKMLQSEDTAAVHLGREIINKFEKDHEYSI
jgi:hypothetical protein